MRYMNSMIRFYHVQFTVVDNTEQNTIFPTMSQSNFSPQPPLGSITGIILHITEITFTE